MSNRNRLHNLAFRGCLIAGLLWAGLAYAQEGTNPAPESQPVPESGQHTSKGGAADQGQQTEPAPEKISPALNQIEAAIRDLIAQERAAQGQGPEDHEISDLEAQEGMAHWAKLMFWATVAAVILTFAGIILIWRTLHHTRRAADYTKGMLDEAKKTTEAAQASVKETKKTAERELRAYLSAIPAGINWLIKSDQGMGHVTIQNVGKLPARNVDVHVRMKMSDGRDKDFQVSDDNRTINRAIPPGTSMTQGSADEIAVIDLCNTREYVYVWGVAHYDDGYGCRRFTRFCHRYNRASRNRDIRPEKTPTKTVSIIDADKARYHEYGNDAT